ncbi:MULTISPECIES: DUF6957 family protein [unclassified Pseudomonas]|jgi:hypothetical protein|uniref:DUF6957 family protein n=1 Tax=unclassified Pseudomonas TaxID=196821 RepID=UPI000C88C1A2|nr:MULTISPECIES: hypothetical protein [unclassified Pseudomonas]PMZ88465.1 hypothetical protein C1X61_13990 [Pseudomonas sp. FW215-T2]PNA16640.1 hypothetical protein C1X62_00675 [Pseudomonas sp. FW215-R3]PNB36419.1 hypothetical protein C1X63_17610 [Pseudomonas sp. FW305-131]
MASVEEPDFMKGPRTPLEGLSSSSEARALVSQRFPGKPYCLITDWTIFRIDVTPDELAKVHAVGQLPMIVFAHNVVEDSQGRFQQGDWVRSSMCTSFNDGVVFETRNTAYVLLGPGHEQPASLKTIFSFF